jgi:hypothetical protein
MNNNNIPSSPSELLAMQEGGIKEEINREDLNALDELIRGQIFHDVNPHMGQVLVLAKRLLEDLESYHWDALENPDLTDQQRRIWKRDSINIEKALMALRLVAES